MIWWLEFRRVLFRSVGLHGVFLCDMPDYHNRSHSRNRNYSITFTENNREIPILDWSINNNNDPIGTRSKNDPMTAAKKKLAACTENKIFDVWLRTPFLFNVHIFYLCKIIWCTLASSKNVFKQLQSSGGELLHNEAHSIRRITFLFFHYVNPLLPRWICMQCMREG